MLSQLTELSATVQCGEGKSEQIYWQVIATDSGLSTGTSPSKMRERLEISAESLYSTIPLLPDLLDQSLSSLSGSEDTGMEVLRRVMMSSDSLLDDASGLSSAFRPDTGMDYDSGQWTDCTDCMQETTESPEMYKAHLRTVTDPILHDNRRLGDDMYDGEEVRMYTELTGGHYREFSPGSTGDSSLEQDLSDGGSSSESGFESPTPEVRWETIAECPSVAISIDPDMQLPPVADILTYRSSKDDFLGLNSHRPTEPVCIKTELPDSEEDSCLSSHHMLHSFSQNYPLCLTVNTNSTTVTTTTTTTNTITVDNSDNGGSSSIRSNSSSSIHIKGSGSNGNGDCGWIMTSQADEENDDLAAIIARKVKATAREKAPRKKPGRKKGQVSKVLHLWEFIRDLLNDPLTCPRIINWENETEGVFRVLHSSEVARLWGEKKKNKRTMTYEKLSRSLRYSRKEGYFDSLPKDKGYPKKLCFKFGPKSHGWKDCTC